MFFTKITELFLNISQPHDLFNPAFVNNLPTFPADVHSGFYVLNFFHVPIENIHFRCHEKNDTLYLSLA